MSIAAPRPIRVFIVHGNPIFLEGARSCLAAADGIFVVGTTDTGLDAMFRISQQRPDLLVLDAHVQQPGAIETAEIVRDLLPRTAILLLVGDDDVDYVLTLWQLGVRGFVPTSAALDQLVGAVRALGAGKTVVVGDIASAALARDTVTLTAREHEVLHLLAVGRRNREIAEELGVVEKTVEFHVRQLRQKLGARSRLEVIYNARKAGLRVDDLPAPQRSE